MDGKESFQVVIFMEFSFGLSWRIIYRYCNIELLDLMMRSHNFSFSIM